MSRLRLFSAALAILPAALTAQTLPIPLGNSSIVPQAPTPLPTPSATPTPFPSPVFSPAPAATEAPTPRATPSPRATERTRSTERSAPRATATPEAAPSPTPTPEASPTAVVTATPSGPIETVVLPRQLQAGAERWPPIWAWFAGGALLLLALAALLLRRRGPADDLAEDDETFTPDAVIAPEPTTALGVARLAVELRPTRAGINLFTATVEAEVVVTNSGDAPARDIRAAVTLLGAGAAANAALDAIATQPVGQPVIAPFALAPGAERRFRAVAVLSLDAIEPLTVAGRPMFVPLVAVTAQWLDGDAAHRITQGYAVGVERVDSAKLAPLWLDVPPRSYDSVAARVHGPARHA